MVLCAGGVPGVVIHCPGDAYLVEHFSNDPHLVDRSRRRAYELVEQAAAEPTSWWQQSAAATQNLWSTAPAKHNTW